MKFFGRIAAVPVRMAAQLASLVTVIDQLPLWSVCWKLSRNAQDGSKLLMQIAPKRGLMSARKLAEQMLAETQDCETAYTIGLLEYMYRQEFDSVEKWVRLAKENGYKNPESLLYLELVLSNYNPAFDREEIVERILSRNDLPAHVTLGALFEKMDGYLERQQWDEAEEIADRILGIQEQTNPRLAKWVVNAAKGNTQAAEQHYLKAKSKIPEERFNIIAAGYSLFLGRIDQAMECLYNGDREMFRIHQLNTPIGQLAISDKFREFCMAKEN